MTGKDMLKGIQNLDANLIEEAEFGTFQKKHTGFSGKKKLLFLLAATLIMGTIPPRQSIPAGQPPPKSATIPLRM